MKYIRLEINNKIYLVPEQYITPYFDSAIRKIKSDEDEIELTAKENISFLNAIYGTETIIL